uniref:Uncharacterized protein n=1 Tax=Anguilla anguilla TaxID=7936 RepID=A0A0E9UPY4_ANGAN
MTTLHICLNNRLHRVFWVYERHIVNKKHDYYCCCC